MAIKNKIQGMGLFLLISCGSGVIELPQNELSSSSATPLCNGTEYNAEIFRCEGGELIGKCKGVDYYIDYQVCTDGIVEEKNAPSSSSGEPSSSSEAVLSSGSEPSSSSEAVLSSGSEPSSSSIGVSCGDFIYNPDSPANANKFCFNGMLYDKCDGMEYNPVAQLCFENAIHPNCGNKPYSPSTHFCHTDGETYSCGNKPYDPATHFCHTDEKTYSCGSKPYNPATHFCHIDGQIYSCGNKPYDPTTHFCHENTQVVAKCGGNIYNPSSQFCYEDNVVGDKCGNRTDIYNPDLYECKPSINDNGIYLKTPISYGGENYEAVLIGTQTWFARNLNYNVDGSKCGNVLSGSGSLVDENTTTCDAYGRLYNWNTAMNNAVSSTAVPSGVQGVCPEGWHLPSDDEWTVFMDFVGANPGMKLKASSSLWNTNTGTDDFGFSALPGGYGYSGGSFYVVGDIGNWWSATQSGASYAYSRLMSRSDSDVDRRNSVKSNLLSVRCVRD